MNINYLQVLNCQTMHGRDCEWAYESHTGEFDGWGKGHMKYRRCLHCQTVEYLVFTSKNGKITDIAKMVEDTPSVTIDP